MIVEDCWLFVVVLVVGYRDGFDQRWFGVEMGFVLLGVGILRWDLELWDYLLWYIGLHWGSWYGVFG
jgi:hypothetical protein